jgi:hypothetical protein
VVAAERVASLQIAGEILAPQTSAFGTPAAAMWRPPRLRLRADGGGVLIRPDALVPFDGSAFGEAVPRAGVLDALPAGGGLWAIDGGGLSRDGERVEGAWERLLGGGGATWAVVRRPRTVLQRLPDGPPRDLGPGGLDPCVDAGGRMAWMEHGRLHVDGAEPVTAERGRAIGLARGRAYLADGKGLSVVELGGGIARRFSPDGIVPGPSGDVLTARVADGRLEVDGRRLALPRVGRDVDWRLIAARPGEYLLWGGARGAAVLAALDPEGAVVRLLDPAPADARLEGWWPAPPYEWQVDREGRVYIVLAGPGKCVVARIVVQ